MGPSSRSSRPRPSEIASDTKRNFIPLLKANYGNMFPPYSRLYHRPTEDIRFAQSQLSTRPPVFQVTTGDPIMQALLHSNADPTSAGDGSSPALRVPFICAANERRPGGDWETGCSGYEEKLCRRSNLSATLSTPWPGTNPPTNYPIPSVGAIMSEHVVVCRGPHDGYERLESWYDLPVISVPPTRWPKLKDGGAKYSFAEERDMMREKVRGALRVCLYHGYDRVVIGDFGLGNGYRNPPQELAEIWRDVLLFDPVLRGRFAYVEFVFDDPEQSTARLIIDEMARKESKSRSGAGSSHKSSSSKSSSSSGKSRSSHHHDSPSSSSRSSGSRAPTDLAIFQWIFDHGEVERVLSERDPRYTLDMITT